MPEFALPPDASLAAVRAWFGKNELFGHGEKPVLRSDRILPTEPLAMAMIAAWTAWCRSEGYATGEQADLASVAQVRTQRECAVALETYSARLDLQGDPEGYAAIRFCVGELTRNVLEHSNSPDGAFVAARSFGEGEPPGVTIAVADCGQGIPVHIARAHPAITDDLTALGMAMRPGITGAQPGPYGSANNAGAGLYITRSIAKASGGAFFLASGRAAYHAPRSRSEDDMMALFVDPFDDPQAEHWTPEFPWIGTVAAVEIRMDTIAHYENLLEWVLKQVPSRQAGHRRIRFT